MEKKEMDELCERIKAMILSDEFVEKVVNAFLGQRLDPYSDIGRSIEATADSE